MEYLTRILWNQLNSESATERAEAWNVRRNPAGRGHERMKKVCATFSTGAAFGDTDRMLFDDSRHR